MGSGPTNEAVVEAEQATPGIPSLRVKAAPPTSRLDRHAISSRIGRAQSQPTKQLWPSVLSLAGHNKARQFLNHPYK